MSLAGREGCLRVAAGPIDPAGLRELLSLWDPRREALPDPAELPPRAAALVTLAASADPDRLAAQLTADGAQVTTLADEEYPAPLRELADPPPALFFRGLLLPYVGPAIAIVGSRKASPYGLRMARELAASLAASGWCVISGLAWGADASAHRGALEAGGRTVGVLGSGLDRPYPADHDELTRKMLERGAVASEFPPGTPPLPQNFPRRNRIIAGLSLGVVVVEAGERSGTLITARLALEQGKEVFAVPHQAGSPGGRGCHLLLRQGATLVEKGEDIEGCWPYLSASPASAVRGTEGPGDGVAGLLREGPATVEELSRRSGVGVPELLGDLSRAELAGSVVRGEGGRYHAA